MKEYNYIYANCCDCGKPLPGIRPNRLAKNPNRRCLACYRKTQRGYSLSQGYVRFSNGRKGKRQYQHRLVAAQALGRDLLPTELVHHKNEVRDDNAPGNFKIYNSPGRHVLDEGHVARDSKGRFATPERRTK